MKDRRIKRLSKGKFYLPPKGILGELKPSDNEVIRSALYDKNELKGYVTGQALYNQLGLITQIPKTIEIAYNGRAQTKDFGTIRIKKITSKAPVRKHNVRLLQYLDVLRDIKIISASNPNLSLRIMQRKVSELPQRDMENLVELAKKYYRPQVRALTGLLLENLQSSLATDLRKTLNPVTSYKLNISSEDWPRAKGWNIRPWG